MKNSLDLYLAAHSTALGSLDLKDDLSVDQSVLAAFGSAGGDARDYPVFRREFETLRGNFQNLRNAPLLSASQDAAKAAAAKTTPAATNAKN